MTDQKAPYRTEIVESDAVLNTYEVPIANSHFSDGISIVMPGPRVTKFGFFEELPGSDHGVGRLHRTNVYITMPTTRFKYMVQILQQAVEQIEAEERGTDDANERA